MAEDIDHPIDATDRASHAEQVATAVGDVLRNGALREAVLEFGETRIVLTKGRRLGEELPALEEPPEYPHVPSRLKDDADSWLR